eukprot:CAMPEP_0185695106 /NCGR_PEP_ID=MMETSP1164-20130828/4319_1 /TAXON_ID=1104430 /ORGANISM="Chrysoreinhardia sp, Strain CCMP2950" /LENGTH=96 /DNA_ID=CAMNT_0028361963 /DNA_START=170 /DNA_END=460 /DNA_ORIENTATION=+
MSEHAFRLFDSAHPGEKLGLHEHLVEQFFRLGPELGSCEFDSIDCKRQRFLGAAQLSECSAQTALVKEVSIFAQFRYRSDSCQNLERVSWSTCSIE